MSNIMKKAFSPARHTRLSVVTSATKASGTKVSPVVKSNNLTILAKLADLGLLSAVEEAGLLSSAEDARLFSKIEEAGLLSFAEKSGAIKIIADPSTPGTLTIAGVLFVVAAVAGSIAGEGPADIAAVVIGILGVTAIIGGSALDKVQKL